jgi:hypothetical protein
MGRDDIQRTYETHVCVVWRDEQKEPLKAVVESCLPEYGSLVIELHPSYYPTNVKARALILPMDLIESVEIEEREPVVKEGYREDSTFRETPENSKWFRGMGSGDERK